MSNTTWCSTKLSKYNVYADNMLLQATVYDAHNDTNTNR